jgi:hypothetical protein
MPILAVSASKFNPAKVRVVRIAESEIHAVGAVIYCGLECWQVSGRADQFERHDIRILKLI